MAITVRGFSMVAICVVVLAAVQSGCEGSGAPASGNSPAANEQLDPHRGPNQPPCTCKGGNEGNFDLSDCMCGTTHCIIEQHVLSSVQNSNGRGDFDNMWCQDAAVPASVSAGHAATHPSRASVPKPVKVPPQPAQ